MGHRRPNASRLFWLASLMFFLSGGTGLAYQVIWFKRFAHVWGSSSLAFASVGGSFLFGLGLGAYLIGRISDRLARPLRWYGYCECLIGILALAIPFEIAWLIELSARFYNQLPQEPFWRFVVQFMVTLLVVGPPCALMGGTLPLLIRQLTARDGSLDQATGWLYAINTLGAAAGCFATGFALLPMLGLLWANLLCAGLNITIGIAALLLARQSTLRGSPIAESNASKSVGSWKLSFTLGGVYAAVALTGLAALVLEMTWSRQLALLLGGSTYAYSATLFVVLLGIAVGSFTYHAALRGLASRPWLVIGVIGVLAASAMAGKLMLPAMARWSADLSPSRGTLSGNAIACAYLSLLLEFVPSVAMGILFPLFVHLTHQTAAAVGRAVGDIYAWNTFGSIAGASLTAILFFPWIGTAGCIALALALYLLALLLVLPLKRGRDTVVAATCLAVGVAMVAVTLTPQDPAATNMGMYMYGKQEDRLLAMDRTFFAEGASSNVFVASGKEGQHVSLRVNGKVDASDGLDMSTQLGLAYFARLFKPDARQVLVIGFGSGTTSGASLLFPDTRVTCCEIEPAVYRASQFFARVNHRPQETTREFIREAILKKARNKPLSGEDEAEIDRKSRFSIVFGDGRSSVQGSEQRYDMILSEPSNPWLAGVSNLFTQEFFEAVHAHLTPGGVLAQWIQTYSFTWSDYLMVVRTLRTVFPHCGLIVLAEGADTVLLASDRPLLPRRAAIEALQQMVERTPEIKQDLAKWYRTTDLRLLLLRHYKMDEATLDRAIEKDGTDRINTDLNQRLEFDAPLHLFRNPPEAQNAQTQIRRHNSDAWQQQLAAAVGIAPRSVEYQLLLAEYELQQKQYAAALAHYKAAMEIEPRAEVYRGTAQAYVLQNKSDAAIVVLRDLLKAHPNDADGMRMLIRQLFARKQDSDAAELLQKLLKQLPDDPEALAQWAAYCLRNKKEAESALALERLIALRPANAVAHADLGACYIALHRPSDAINQYREALALKPIGKMAGAKKVKADPQNVSWANNLAWLLATVPDARLRNGPEAVELATAACESAGYKGELVDTLAAAYAEVGRFDEAVKFCQQYLDQAALTQPDRLDRARSRLKLYQARQPFRDS